VLVQRLDYFVVIWGTASRTEEVDIQDFTCESPVGSRSAEVSRIGLTRQRWSTWSQEPLVAEVHVTSSLASLMVGTYCDLDK